MLYLGDCLEELKKVKEKTVDMVICDLPYGITNCNWDIKLDLDKLWIELKRVSKEKTPFFFFCNLKFGYEIIKANESWFKYDIIWCKNRLSNPLTTNSRFATAHETILVFYKKSPVYNYKDYHKLIKTEAKNIIRNHITGTEILGSKKASYEPRLPLSYITCNAITGNKTNINKSKHSTQKPVELLETLIKYYSNEGDTILDPTFGSGSTYYACKNQNRNFIGIEMNETYYKNLENEIKKTDFCI
jgi:site-specific DNA-methyltransferase (adenine-specific)